MGSKYLLAVCCLVFYMDWSCVAYDEIRHTFMLTTRNNGKIDPSSLEIFPSTPILRRTKKDSKSDDPESETDLFFKNLQSDFFNEDFEDNGMTDEDFFARDVEESRKRYMEDVKNLDKLFASSAKDVLHKGVNGSETFGVLNDNNVSQATKRSTEPIESAKASGSNNQTGTTKSVNIESLHRPDNSRLNLDPELQKTLEIHPVPGSMPIRYEETTDVPESETNKKRNRQDSGKDDVDKFNDLFSDTPRISPLLESMNVVTEISVQETVNGKTVQRKPSSAEIRFLNNNIEDKFNQSKIIFENEELQHEEEENDDVIDLSSVLNVDPNMIDHDSDRSDDDDDDNDDELIEDLFDILRKEDEQLLNTMRNKDRAKNVNNTHSIHFDIRQDEVESSDNEDLGKKEETKDSPRNEDKEDPKDYRKLLITEHKNSSNISDVKIMFSETEGDFFDEDADFTMGMNERPLSGRKNKTNSGNGNLGVIFDDGQTIATMRNDIHFMESSEDNFPEINFLENNDHDSSDIVFTTEKALSTEDTMQTIDKDEQSDHFAGDTDNAVNGDQIQAPLPELTYLANRILDITEHNEDVLKFNNTVSTDEAFKVDDVESTINSTDAVSPNEVLAANVIDSINATLNIPDSSVKFNQDVSKFNSTAAVSPDEALRVDAFEPMSTEANHPDSTTKSNQDVLNLNSTAAISPNEGLSTDDNDSISATVNISDRTVKSNQDLSKINSTAAVSPDEALRVDAIEPMSTEANQSDSNQDVSNLNSTVSPNEATPAEDTDSISITLNIPDLTMKSHQDVSKFNSIKVVSPDEPMSTEGNQSDFNKDVSNLNSTATVSPNEATSADHTDTISTTLNIPDSTAKSNQDVSKINSTAAVSLDEALGADAFEPMSTEANQPDSITKDVSKFNSTSPNEAVSAVESISVTPNIPEITTKFITTTDRSLFTTTLADIALNTYTTIEGNHDDTELQFSGSAFDEEQLTEKNEEINLFSTFSPLETIKTDEKDDKMDDIERTVAILKEILSEDKEEAVQQINETTEVSKYANEVEISTEKYVDGKELEPLATDSDTDATTKPDIQTSTTTELATTAPSAEKLGIDNTTTQEEITTYLNEATTLVYNEPVSTDTPDEGIFEDLFISPHELSASEVESLYNSKLEEYDSMEDELDKFLEEHDDWMLFGHKSDDGGEDKAEEEQTVGGIEVANEDSDDEKGVGDSETSKIASFEGSDVYATVSKDNGGKVDMVPILRAVVLNNTAEFSVKVSKKDVTFFVPSTARVENDRTWINVTWKANARFNNSIALRVLEKEEFFIIKEVWISLLIGGEVVYQRKAVAFNPDPVLDDSVSGKNRVVMMRDGTYIFLSNVDFLKKNLEPLENSEAAMRERRLWHIEIASICLAAVVVIAVVLYVIAAKTRRKLTLREKNELAQVTHC